MLHQMVIYDRFLEFGVCYWFGYGDKLFHILDLRAYNSAADASRLHCKRAYSIRSRAISLHLKGFAVNISN